MEEELIKRIATVADVHAETMRNHPTTFSWETLPFYSKFRLLRAVIKLRHRPVELQFADDGERLLVLRSGSERIYEVNAEEGLELDVGQFPAYLKFFFDNVGGQIGRIEIYENPADLPWLPPPTDEDLLAKIKEAHSLIKPFAISKVGQDSYAILAVAVRARTLIELNLLLKINGNVVINDERTLMEEIHVPYLA